MYFSLDVSYVLTLLIAVPAGFLLRTVILFHDCAHGSLLLSKRANAWLGCAGVETKIPSPLQRDRYRHRVGPVHRLALPPDRPARLPARPGADHARIPNYNLQRAHDDHPICHGVPTLSLWDGIRAVRLKLWDEQRGRLVTFAEARPRWAPNPPGAYARRPAP